MAAHGKGGRLHQEEAPPGGGCPGRRLHQEKAPREEAPPGGGYLVGALPHGVDELLDHHVHTLHTRLLQLHHLLLHDGLEGHVGGEEARPAAGRTQQQVSRTSVHP